MLKFGKIKRKKIRNTIQALNKVKKFLELGLNPESADIGYNGVEDRDNRKIIYDNAAATMPNMDSVPCCPLGALLELIPHTGFDGIELNDYNDGKTIGTGIFH